MVSIQRSFRRLSFLGLAALLASCGAAGNISSSAIGPATLAPVQAPADSPETWPVRKSPKSDEDLLFDAALKKLGDVEFEQVMASYGPLASEQPVLSFDPTTADMFKEVSSALAMTEEEKRLFRQLGFVSLSRHNLGSMTGGYFGIYNRDLPVLVTTDSILDALHRSFDEALKELEETALVASLAVVLEKTHERLEMSVSTTPAQLQDSLRDVDLYLTVARNLLAEGGEPGGSLVVPSKLHNDDRASVLLTKIDNGHQELGVPLYGTRRAIDFSQFKPRGHYVDSPVLSRYFKAISWVGRLDLGFELFSASGSKGGDSLGRDGTSAAILAWLIRESGRAESLRAMGEMIGFLMGEGDGASPAQLSGLMKGAGISTLAQLAEPTSRARLVLAIQAQRAGNQRIRSQVLFAGTPNPSVFQLFGQRFAIDSFVLANVVFSQIVYRGETVSRDFPTGLDVMASLGNPEAVSLLEPELRKWHYGANLLAARSVVDAYEPKAWSSSAYTGWLDSLRSLDDRPDGAAFPQVMQSRAWQRKQLQTQLASWAQLRHDTILYSKQSYSNYSCSYPSGYVEPYPEFYARMGRMAAEGKKRMASLELPDADAARGFPFLKKAIVDYFDRFAGTMVRLEGLARKELASTPFTQDEQDFLVRLMDKRGRGSGPPRYDGWYPGLVFGNPNDQFKPVVADVHTDPNSGQILHAAVGNTRLLVVAIDNQNDRRVYVGPSFTYHEFLDRERLTDHGWKERLERGEPVLQHWARVFSGPEAAPEPIRPVRQGGRPPIPRPPR